MSCWVALIPLLLLFIVGLCFVIASRGEVAKLEVENALLKADIDAKLQRLAEKYPKP